MAHMDEAQTGHYPRERERVQTPDFRQGSIGALGMNSPMASIPQAERLMVMEKQLSNLFTLHEEVLRRTEVIASELGIRF